MSIMFDIFNNNIIFILIDKYLKYGVYTTHIGGHSFYVCLLKTIQICITSSFRVYAACASLILSVRPPHKNGLWLSVTSKALAVALKQTRIFCLA